jgi:hypothetical protein
MMTARESDLVLVRRWAWMVIPLILERADDCAVSRALAAQIRADLEDIDESDLDARLADAVVRVGREVAESVNRLIAQL